MSPIHVLVFLPYTKYNVIAVQIRLHLFSTVLSFPQSQPLNPSVQRILPLYNRSSRFRRRLLHEQVDALSRKCRALVILRPEILCLPGGLSARHTRGRHNGLRRCRQRQLVVVITQTEAAGGGAAMAEVFFGAKEPESRGYGFGLGKEALGGEFPLNQRVSLLEDGGLGAVFTQATIDCKETASLMSKHKTTTSQ